MARKKRKGTRRKVTKPKKRQTGKSPREVLVKALSHPVRVKALTILSERIASPKEISEQIDVPLSNVSYHVRILEGLGLIEVLEEESVRGAVAHFYKAVERPLIDNPDWENLAPKVRSAFSGYVVETLMSDAARSLAAGVFDLREDRHLTRTPLLLDEEGWQKVADLQIKALNEILKEQVAAEARLEASDADPIQAIAALALFEVPPEKSKD